MPNPPHYSEAKDRLLMALANYYARYQRDGSTFTDDEVGRLMREQCDAARAVLCQENFGKKHPYCEHVGDSCLCDEYETKPCAGRTTPPPAEKLEGWTVEGEMSRLIDHMSRYSGTQPVGWARNILALARADRERVERAIAVLRVASTANAEKAFDILMGRS